MHKHVYKCSGCNMTFQFGCKVDDQVTATHSRCGGYLAYHGPTTERSEDRTTSATDRKDEPRPGGGSRYAHPGPVTSEATDKLKTWDEKFAEEFLTQDRTNEAITDARIDAYEQYAKGSVGACRQDIAELVAEVRRLRAEPRTDYPIPKVGDVTPQGTVQEVLVRFRVRRSDGADVYLTPEETQKSSGLWTDCLPGTGQKRSDP